MKEENVKINITAEFLSRNKYVVKKPFKDVGGAWRRIGDIINLDRTRANQLQQYGFIDRPIETAKIEPPERAVKPKPKNKKKKRLPVGEIEELIKESEGIDIQPPEPWPHKAEEE